MQFSSKYFIPTTFSIVFLYRTHVRLLYRTHVKDGLAGRTRLKWPLPKDGLLRCERRLFTLQYTSFCNVMGGILQSLYRYTGLMEPNRLPLLGFRTDFDVMIEASMQRCEEILTAGPRLHEAVALLSR